MTDTDSRSRASEKPRERVARAMHEDGRLKATGRSVAPWNELPESQRVFWRERADAAITALEQSEPAGPTYTDD